MECNNDKVRILEDKLESLERSKQSFQFMKYQAEFNGDEETGCRLSKLIDQYDKQIEAAEEQLQQIK
ncbi:TPA: hypothetical protein ROX98_000518 [Bacillus pseudomycoides]|nr:hypothetical protein [Bacillus pseudomycoides]